MVAGRTRELEQTRRLEQGMVAVRWFGVAFGLFQVWQSTSVSPKPPGDVTARGYGLAIALFVGNIVITTLVPRARRRSQLSAIGFGAFFLDTVVCLGFIWDYSFTSKDNTWVVGYILPLEGALRYRLLGALAAAALFSLSESLREVYLGATIASYDPEVANVTFRAGVGVIVASVAGVMARSLEREAAKATDRAMMAEESARREKTARRELDLFHSAVLAGVAAQDLEPSLHSMADAIAHELGFESCGILLLEDGVLRARGVHGFPEDVRGREIQLGEGVVGKVAATGTPLLVPDVHAFPEYVELDPRTAAEAAVPLMFHDEVIGVLNVQSSSSESLSDSTLDLLSRLADQISLVVHSAHLQARQKETLGRLQELDRMKSDFVAITSHELRTPLTAIRGFIKTMLKNYDRLSAADMKDFLTIVDRQSHRLARLVEDLLMVSKIEAGELTISPEPVVPLSFLANLLASFGENADRIKLRVEGEAPDTMVVDPYRVEQILRNLLHNALKFSPPKTPITLAAQFNDGVVEMSVEDRGVGIPPEDHERIFERFHQAGDTTTREAEGAGLGLYITKRLVEAMGGRVELQSQPGRGSTFTIRLPLVEDHEPSILDMEAAPAEYARDQAPEQAR